MLEIILFGAIVVCIIILLICRLFFPSVIRRSPQPIYYDFAHSFLPVILIVFLLRSFIVEPFRIPSGSMLPTLEVGDFLLVNKFTYGIRLPIIFQKVIEVDKPERGDVIVFRWPGDNETNYIKRVIGLPGDTIEFDGRSVRINGKFLDLSEDGRYEPFSTKEVKNDLARFIQRIPHQESSDEAYEDYSILLEARTQSPTGKIRVPEDSYWVLGDNRDHSLDSRYWGMVPDENIVGKAFFIWFHLNLQDGGGFKWSRIGTGL